ncbi:adenosine kinase [Gilvimarinus sp. F26214L]|uniref:adenosine kinase n=1 Tax=Gilvimarinus sp. DZF01 TaxID=3461371 RepID=UPI004046001D
MSKYHIYGIGAALVDTEIEVTDTDLEQMEVDKGLMTLVDEGRQHQLIEQLSGHLVHSKRASGGSAANTIIAASYFGGNNVYSCKVADDENGEFYINDLRAAGVDYPYNGGLESGITGRCLVMITPDAERTMTTFLGVSASLSEAELHPHVVPDCQYVYMEGYLVSSPTGKTAAIKLRELAEQHGVRTSISLSDPAMVEHFGDGLKEMIGSGVDLIFCNEQEAMGFTGCASLEAAAEGMKEYARTFAITLGARGALVYDGDKLISIAPQTVKAVDTNGAGDMFAGAFLYAITHGHSHETAGELASHAAAHLVTQWGPRLPPEQHEHIRRRVLGQ